MNKAIARYWRQVHKVQRMTGTSSARARRAVTLLRQQGVMTAHASAKRPKLVKGASNETFFPKGGRPKKKRTRETGDQFDAPSRPKHYRDLDDWIDSFESWDGDYDYNDYDTGVDTGGAD